MPSIHIAKRAPASAETSTGQLDPSAKAELLRERFRIACDVWKRRNDGNRCHFAEALGVSERSVKHWLASDEERPVPEAMVTLAEEIAAASPDDAGGAELAEARLNYLQSLARLRAVEAKSA